MKGNTKRDRCTDRKKYFLEFAGGCVIQMHAFPNVYIFNDFFVLEHSEGWHKTSCEALNNIPLEPTYNTIPMP